MSAVCRSFGLVACWAQQYCLPVEQRLLQGLVHSYIFNNNSWDGFDFFLNVSLMCVFSFIGPQEPVSLGSDADLGGVE